jgi:hypothetical protein
MASDPRTSSPSDRLRPPVDLPTDPDRFYRGAHDVPLHEDSFSNQPSALDRLGSSPIPKTGFPFLGFLSGVYEHVSTIAAGTPSEGGQS